MKSGIPWGRIAAEFIAILAGVTLALLADDWRDFRRDRTDERLALQEILADLEADSVELAAQFKRQQQANAAVLWTLRNVERDPPADTLLSGMTPLFYYTSYEAVSSGYRGLRDSGRLPLIRTVEIRRKVVDYYEVTQPYMKSFYDDFLAQYTEFKGTTAPYIRLIPDSVGDVFAESFDPVLVRPWRAMREDYRFLYETEELGTIVSTFALRIGPALEKNSELRGLIRDVIG